MPNIKLPSNNKTQMSGKITQLSGTTKKFNPKNVIGNTGKSLDTKQKNLMDQFKQIQPPSGNNENATGSVSNTPVKGSCMKEEDYKLESSKTYVRTIKDTVSFCNFAKENEDKDIPCIFIKKYILQGNNKSLPFYYINNEYEVKTGLFVGTKLNPYPTIPEE